MNLEHTLQNLEFLQKKLLEHRDKPETIELLSEAYRRELEHFGPDGLHEQQKMKYGFWYQYFSQGQHPSPIPWRPQ